MMRDTAPALYLGGLALRHTLAIASPKQPFLRPSAVCSLHNLFAVTPELAGTLVFALLLFKLRSRIMRCTVATNPAGNLQPRDDDLMT